MEKVVFNTNGIHGKGKCRTQVPHTWEINRKWAMLVYENVSEKLSFVYCMSMRFEKRISQGTHQLVKSVGNV